MPRMRTWLCCVVLLTSGCIVPRSMVLGQMAAPVGRGAADVTVHTGIQYAEQTNPRFEGVNDIGDPISTEQKSTGFVLPSFEANLQYGFDENVALNVHGSSAGIQPGLKWTVNRSKTAHFALMPQVAFGYASNGIATNVYGNDGVQQPGAPSTGTSFTFLGGLRAFASHKSGIYGGVGYDFLFNRNFNKTRVGTGNASIEQDTIHQTTGHQISINLGFDIALGFIHIRPEIAVALYPGIGQTRTVNTAGSEPFNQGATGGFGWAIFPGFSIGAQTPRRELTEAEEEEEAAKANEERKRKKRRGQVDEEVDEDDDDDDDEKPAPKRKSRSSDDDEDAPKKNSRKEVEWED